MKIQYVSDLHLEGCMVDIENKQGADLLILAGDITTAKSYKNHFEFFRKCSESFKDVVYVLGNHEFYHGDIEETNSELFKWLYTNFKNIYLLDDGIIKRNGYTIFGGTLWTDCNKGDPLTKETIRNGMNDYRLIQWKYKELCKITPEDTIKLHNQTLEGLKVILEEGDPTIIVTHHGPSKRSVHPRFSNDYHMNGGFVSSLEYWFLEKGYNVPLWIHGHVHDTFDYMLDKTRVVTNPRGYMIPGRDGKRYPENELFDPNKIIEV